MLDASPRVVAAAASGLIDLHAPRVVEHADGTTTRADARSCGKANHASLTRICDVEQLYTDAALMLDASPRVVAAAGSGLIDLHLRRRVDHAEGTQHAPTVLMLGLVRGSLLRESPRDL